MPAPKCYQCPKPAFYVVEDEQVPLCLDCYGKYAHLKEMQLASMERHLNYISDEMDSVIGIGPIGPRFPPRPAPIITGGIRLHNISVSNSVVGTLNTGSIGSVDQSISALIQTGEPEVARALKSLSEAILASNDMSANQKTEVMEALSIVASEASAPADKRKKGVARTLIKEAAEWTKSAADIAEAAAKFWPIISAAFQ